MTRTRGRWLVAAAMISLSGTGRGAPEQKADAPDPIRDAWRARAKVAQQRLAGLGLDACDRGVETAFRDAQEKVRPDGRRDYTLEIPIGEERMLLVYSYAGRKLEKFTLLALPGGWFAYQNVDSKTLTVLVGDRSSVMLSPTGCALDLCTNDPMAMGPCPEKPGR